MKAITRRGFMRLVAGVATSGALVGAKVVSNASDAADVVWPEVKTLVGIKVFKQGDFTDYAVGQLEGHPYFPQNRCEREKYNVIDDLVEEMNRNDTEHPNQHGDYVIHCNYSGLGMLNQTGQLEKEDYEPSIHRGYKHVLWIPLNLEGCCRGIKVGASIVQKADIILVRECVDDFSNGFYVPWCITTRCFNVDYTKSGKALMSLC